MFFYLLFSFTVTYAVESKSDLKTTKASNKPQCQSEFVLTRNKVIRFLTEKQISLVDVQVTKRTYGFENTFPRPKPGTRGTLYCEISIESKNPNILLTKEKSPHFPRLKLCNTFMDSELGKSDTLISVVKLSSLFGSCHVESIKIGMTAK